MSRARFSGSLAALVMIFALNQQVATIAADDAGENWESRLARVQHFDEGQQLPDDRVVRPSKVMDSQVAGLGRVARLDTYMAPMVTGGLSPPTNFHIYTRGKKTSNIDFRGEMPEFKMGAGQVLDWQRDFQYDLLMMLESGFDVNKQTVVMIPGYLNHGETPWEHEAAEYWMQLYRDESNVIVVSWPAAITVYSQAVADTVYVARQLTVFLHYLAQLGGTSLRDQTFLDRIHLVGHSLGAHIAAFVGQDLGGHVGRITGLDPAGPSFDCYPTNQRLDRGDAQLVEVLHTNAGKMHYAQACVGALVNKFASWLKPRHERVVDGGSWFGISAQVGHIDYYANDGSHQEGCTDALHTCDHGRANEIYVDLLRYELFLRENDYSSPDARFRHSRLWAFRAPDYPSFMSGTHFIDSCPDVIQPQVHLNQLQVAKSIRQCAVPLIDFTKPARELIDELSQDFGIDFSVDARSEDQARFYFRTQQNPQDPRQLLGDHFLLKLYLNPDETQWDSSQCLLVAHLQMADGQQIHLNNLHNLQAGQQQQREGSEAILALPFAHPAGQLAHASLRTLLAKMATDTEGGAQSSDQVRRLFRRLFPRSVSLDITGWGGNRCLLGVKGVEMQPVSVYTPNNVAVFSGLKPNESPLFEELQFVSASEFPDYLAGTVTQRIEFGEFNFDFNLAIA